MIKFIHAADFHLDSAFSNLSLEQAKERRKEQRQALADFAKACEGYDFVLLAGDLFDGDQVYLDTVEALKSCFASIAVPIYIAPGNHDPMKEDSPYFREDWGENVHIFKKQEIERIELPGCDLYGAAFTQGNWEPLKNFTVADPMRLNILLLHTGAEYNPITVEQIAGSGLDYLALGHVHSADIRKEGDTTYAYSGCLMGTGFDECGKKGLLRVRLSKFACEPEFYPLEARRYEILEVELGEDPVQSILTALPGDSEEHLFSITLYGRALDRPLSELKEELSKHCYSVELYDKTDRRGDLWNGMEEDTLRGEFLKELHLRWEQADSEQEKEQIRGAAQLLRDLMDGREVSL